MKNTYLLLILLHIGFLHLDAQETKHLPKGFAEGEKALMPTYLLDRSAMDACALTEAPNVPIRSMAEWEELQSIAVTWDNLDYQLVADIIRYAREEVEVVVLAQNPSTAQNQLLNNYGFENLDNIRLVQAPTNSIWMRDYGANPCYLNDVDSLVFVDWIYNRPRPLDDDAYCIVAEEMNIPMYQTVEQPNDLVHTGGNFMADGLGIAFSSNLLEDENDDTNQWGMSDHTTEEIEEIMYNFMGIEEYILMEKLPYDGISHIDMHMKLLDEETLLIAAYPQDVSDGPQIEANIEFIKQNFKTAFGTDYRIVRIDSPPDAQGDYPGWPFGNGDYLTYTNALFVNKTVLVPIYLNDEDDKALAIWREALPGYNIQGLDCRNIIRYGGAIHCITKEIGVADPLLITHPQLRDVEYKAGVNHEVKANIKHRSGISEAILHYKTTLSGNYTAIAMNPTDQDNWSAAIPNQPAQTTIYYYIEATANSGKTQNRPMPAPEGYFKFKILDEVVSVQNIEDQLLIGEVFPNPARALTYIPIENQENISANISIIDALGQEVISVFKGQLVQGKYNYFFDASKLPSGTYFVKIISTNMIVTKKFIKQ